MNQQRGPYVRLVFTWYVKENLS